MQSSSLLREWSSKPEKTVSGTPPHQGDNIETVRSEYSQQDVRVITPMYKSGGLSPGNTLDTGSKSPRSLHTLGNNSDYRVEQRQEHYKLNIIDPKVESHGSIPVHSQTLPSAYRKRNLDFPSSHTKRSFLNVSPLEPRRLRSVETRPVTTNDYLTESLERHRAMEASKLREQLKVKEKEVNRPWEKPDRPGWRSDLDGSANFLKSVTTESQYRQEKLSSSLMRSTYYDENLMYTTERKVGTEKRDEDPQTKLAASTENAENTPPPEKKTRTRARSLDLVKKIPLELKVFMVDTSERRHSTPTDREQLVDVKRRTRSADPSPTEQHKPHQHIIPLPVIRGSKHSYSRSNDAQMNRLGMADELGAVTVASYDFPFPHPPPPPTAPKPSVTLYPQSRTFNQTPVVQMQQFGGSSHSLQHRARDGSPDSIRYQQSGNSSVYSQYSTNRTQQYGNRTVYEEFYPAGPRHETVGHFTQLTLPPQKVVYENQPIAKPVDASHRDPSVEFATPTRVLRETFVEKNGEDSPQIRRSGRIWSKEDYATWEPLTGSSYPVEPNQSVVRQSRTTHRVHEPTALSKRKQVSISPFRKDQESTMSVSSKSMYSTSTSQQQLQQHDQRQLQSAYRDYTEEALLQKRLEEERRMVMQETRRLEEERRIEEERLRRLYLMRQQEEMHLQTQRKQFQQQEQHQQMQQSQKQQSSQMEKQEPKMPPSILKRDDPPSSSRKPGELSVYRVSQEQIQEQEERLRLAERNAQSGLSPGGTSWKRTYVVEPVDEDETLKNKITTSEELLREEAYYVDLLARRDAFIEKPKPPPEIKYVGKVWQPPPDKPYEFPQRGPLKEWVPADDKGHMWEPFLPDVEFKYERKNFTPEPSPPPRRRSFNQPGPLPPAMPQPGPPRTNPHPPSVSPLPPPPSFVPDQRTPRAPEHTKDPALDIRMRVIPPGGRPQSVTPSEASSLSAYLPGFTDSPRPGHPKPPPKFPTVESPHPTHAPHPQQRSRREPYYPGQDPRPGFLENEPTPRHSSTIIPEDRPKVNVKNRIRAFEPGDPPPHSPRRVFGDPALHRPSTAASSLSLDDDVFGENRAVRFADKSHVIMRPPKQPMEMFLQESGRDGLHVRAGPYTHNMALSNPNQKVSKDVLRSASATTINVRGDPSVPATSTPKRNEELDELTRLRELLAERARNRDTDYKLTPAQIRILEAEKSAKDRVRDVQSSLSGSSAHFNKFNTASSSNEAATESVATWQFSNTSFSPRSIVSVNGHKEDGGLLRVRTDLSPLSRVNAGVQTQTSSQQHQSSQMWPLQAVLLPIQPEQPRAPIQQTQETKYRESVERYRSHDEADSKGSTLIRIKDERSKKPGKSIMKANQRQEMESEGGWERRQSNQAAVPTTIVRQIAPGVTETIQQVEETKRTEEIERRIERREKKDKRRKGEKRRDSRGGGHWVEGPRPDETPWTTPFDNVGAVTQNVAPPKPSPKPLPPPKVKTSSGAQTDFPLVPKVIEKLVHEPPQPPIIQQVPWNQHQEAAWHQYGHTNGYIQGQQQPYMDERYQKQTTTKRVKEGGSSSSQHGGSSNHRRNSSLTDSLRRRDATYLPNGDIQMRRRHGSVHSHRGGNHHSGVHKSRSSKDVYRNEMADADYMRGGPIVEFPPTLTRDGGVPPPPPPHRYAGSSLGRQSGAGTLRKSRSFADWEVEPRGRDRRDDATMMRWDGDPMTRLEQDFRDHLLMPMPAPGQHVNDREYRQEEIPGGYETFSKDVKADTGRVRRHGERGPVTHYNEAKQEFKYSKETKGDRDRRR